MARGLTKKQKRFVWAYQGEAAGNATQAARLAGYGGNDRTLAEIGRENLGKPGIQEALAATPDEVSEGLVAGAIERQELLTAVMRGEVKTEMVTKDGEVVDVAPRMTDRLKAAELLGKIKGDYIERKEVKHEGIGRVEVVLPDNGRDGDE